MSAPQQSINEKPISALFHMVKNVRPVRIFITERSNMYYNAILTGFDERMNVVLTNVEEVNTKSGTKLFLGDLFLRGDNIELISEIDQQMA